jgi:monothiol glutaredoxin
MAVDRALKCATGAHMSDAQESIRKTVSENDVVLFMKGTADQPMCGFSNQVVRILDHLGVDYVDVNVLADEDIRQGVKDFTSWPTIPQLYVKGEFVGGCDIVREMFQTGELKTLFADKGVTVAA